MLQEAHTAKKRRIHASQLEPQPSFLEDLEQLQETNQATKGTDRSSLFFCCCSVRFFIPIPDFFIFDMYLFGFFWLYFISP